MPLKKYDILSQNDESNQHGVIQWICPECHSGCSKIMALLKIVTKRQEKHDRAIQSIGKDVSNLSKKIEKCNKDLVEVQQSINNIKEEATKSSNGANIDHDVLKSEIIREIEEREKRKLNLIVYDLSESNEGNTQARMNADRTFIADMIKSEIGKEIQVTEAVRLGKISIDGKPRPTWILLQSEADKVVILRNAKSLKSSTNDITKNLGIKTDQTPCQRNIWRRLVKEREEKRAQQQTKEEKERWQIRNLKVVQLPARTQRQ